MKISKMCQEKAEIVAQKRGNPLNSRVATSNDHGQQSHPDVHAVFRLSEVCGPRIGIKVTANFVQTWQRMQDNGALLGQGHQLGGNYQLATALK